MTWAPLKFALIVVAPFLAVFIASLFLHLPGDDETLDDGDYDHGDVEQ